MIRICHGYDVHRLVPDRQLILGGVEIDYDFGLLGHSDADVLLHAICDALLGAIGKGDIGVIVPDTDPLNKNRDSREFLRHIRGLMEAESCRLGNADMTIVAQSPRMQSYIPAMKENIAIDLNTEVSRLNIKATTTEKLGFTGRQEGIAVHAIVLVEQN